MQILVLGGTAWLGGHIAATAMQQGHNVTCLARGNSGGVPDGATFVYGDRGRPGAYDELLGTNWDTIVDVSSQPGQVGDAAVALRDRTQTFIYISSCSAYADHASFGQDEGAATLPALATDVMETMETFGQAKVACEHHVLAAFGPNRSMLVRAGLIGGPGDITDRSGYWPLRFARPSNEQGRVLTPETPNLATQVIDVRDLACWIIDSAAVKRNGIFNAVGEIVPLHRHLAAAREVAGHKGPLVSCPSEWLLAQNVNPWRGERSLPLWLPMPEYAAFCARDNNAARAAGLTIRALEETLADTLAWELEANPLRPRKAGLTNEEEKILLSAYEDARK